MNDQRVGTDPRVREQVRTVRDRLMEGLVERETEIRLALLAALAGEHLLLLGPPGTAKSELARRLHLAFDGPAYFERLLTRFSVPEELFGPLSIKGLEEDRYERKTEGYLPRASIAFIDEIFKANSAILNALLTILNERLFDQGTSRIQVPLVCVVGASNEIPDDAGLAALYDRFLLRCAVTPVSRQGFDQLLDLPSDGPLQIPPDMRLRAADVDRIRATASRVKLSRDAREMLTTCRAWLAEQEMFVSDRRWRKIVKLLRVAACADGRDEVSVWDCWLLQHCTWEKPEQREAILGWYRQRLGAVTTTTPAAVHKAVTVWETKLKRDKEELSQKRDEKGRLLYKGKDGKETTKDHSIEEERYYNSSKTKVPHEPILGPRPFSPFEIDARLGQVEALGADVARHKTGLEGRRAEVEHLVLSHLWIAPGFAAVASEALQREIAEMTKLQVRIAALKSGFEKLPRTKDPEVEDEPDLEKPPRAKKRAGDEDHQKDEPEDEEIRNK